MKTKCRDPACGDCKEKLNNIRVFPGKPSRRVWRRKEKYYYDSFKSIM